MNQNFHWKMYYRGKQLKKLEEVSALSWAAMAGVLGWPQLCHLEPAALYVLMVHLPMPRVGGEAGLPDIVVVATNAT